MPYPSLIIWDVRRLEELVFVMHFYGPIHLKLYGLGVDWRGRGCRIPYSLLWGKISLWWIEQMGDTEDISRWE